MQPRALSSYLCVVAADAVAVATLRPDMGVLIRHLAAPHAWVQAVGADTAAATLAAATLWLAGVWLALGLLAGAIAAAPGVVGRTAAGLTRVLLPGALYRIAVGATGAGLVLAPIAGATAIAGGGMACAAGSAAAAVPPVPTPMWPTSAPDPSAGQHAIPTPSPPPPTPATDVITVRRGDSLWSIAAARLGRGASDAAITAGWRDIYRANRAVIGPNPDLIRPGQHLRIEGEARS